MRWRRCWRNGFGRFSSRYGGYGQITRIGHLGSYPAGKDRTSFHNTGEAVDISWLQWSTGQSCRPCNGKYNASDPINRRRLVAVEASLRKHFGTVLNRGYPGHFNHFHVDTGCPVRFRPKSYSSHRLFARDCIEAFTGTAIGYDQCPWRDGTAVPTRVCPREDNREDEIALSGLLTSLGMDCLDIENKISDYQVFLSYIMMHGFANADAGEFRYGADVPEL